MTIFARKAVLDLVREGTRRLLEQHSDIVVVGEAADGAEAVTAATRLKPDVVLLDIRMPELSGIEATRQILEQVPSTAVLILSAYDDDDYILALMEAGASGYLLKTAQARELIESVRSVQLGESVLHPAIAAKQAKYENG